MVRRTFLLLISAGVLVTACGSTMRGTRTPPSFGGEVIQVRYGGHPLTCLWVPAGSAQPAGLTCDWVRWHAEVGDIPGFSK